MRLWAFVKFTLSLIKSRLPPSPSLPAPYSDQSSLILLVRHRDERVGVHGQADPGPRRVGLRRRRRVLAPAFRRQRRLAGRSDGPRPARGRGEPPRATAPAPPRIQRRRRRSHRRGAAQLRLPAHPPLRGRHQRRPRWLAPSRGCLLGLA
jgi:hypothetical protein